MSTAHRFPLRLPRERHSSPLRRGPRRAGLIKLAGGHRATSRRPSLFVKAVLFSPSAAALDEYDQHNHEQHARNNPDYRGTVHVEFPLIDPNHLKCHERWIDSGTPDAEAAGFPSVTLAAASGAR